MEASKSSPIRIFINTVDSYGSKYIAKFLSECVYGAQASEEETETEEEEQERLTTSGSSRQKAFQIVGTVHEPFAEENPHVQEVYANLNRDELLLKLLDCDVIIYNITQYVEQVEEAFWAVTAVHNEMDNFTKPKMFILVSTVMTWARSKPFDEDDPELPLTEELLQRRRTHPKFKAHTDVEKRVVKKGKTNRALFSTYVVVSGLQYGMGEQMFHYFFKTSWLGIERDVPVFGDGSNFVPTIHISDLACVIQKVIEQKPETYYILAVDNSINNTMESIVKAVASLLGPGRIRRRPHEQAFLIEDMSVMEADSLTVNLRMESVHLKEHLSIPWLCETGLVENIDLVVEEYRRTRGLLPICLCVLGPPSVGKSTVSKRISEHYKLHHIRLKSTIAETISKLEETARNTDPHSEIEDSAEAQEMLDNILENMEQNGGLLDDQMLVKVVKDKLTSNPCRNQGFVLDGFPKTYEQANDLFDYKEGEEEDGTASDRSIFPEFLFFLDASDPFLKDRVMSLPEKLVEENNYHQEHFLQRLAKYRENNMKDETVSNFFDEVNITPLCMEITSSDEPDSQQLMQKIFDTIGKPRNYGPTIKEVKEEEQRRAEKRMRQEAQEKAERERREAEEERQRTERWEEWTKHLEEVRQQEEDLLEARSAPMRNYLMSHIMPTLTQGLMECCTAQPQDPVDFLAEYLIRNNPLNC